MLPTLTLSGVDERMTLREIEQLLARPRVELGLLYTHDPEGRPRYPALHWLVWVAEVAAGRCAVHICGRRARAELMDGKLADLVAPATRIQVNGVLPVEDVAAICQRYAGHEVITQHHGANVELVQVAAANHALLVDASGGAGQLPERWERPATQKSVGFAGGLGPENISLELPAIAAVAGAGRWWLDMEGKLRIDDQFSPRRAHQVIDTFARWCDNNPDF